MSEGAAVTVAPKTALVDPRVREAKERNAIVTAIRGQMWSKDLSDVHMRSIAEYCHRNGMDPVRHIEVLGGKIYPTATLYEERAAPFIQAGALIPHEPDHINADPRLDQLAEEGDEWAKEERTRRLRLRIEHNVPEKADGAVVYRITVAATGKTVVGVNWCGKGLRMKKRKDGSTYDDDPVGGNEPSKTAITRAGRRAWKLVVEAVPTYGRELQRIEAQGEEISDALVEEIAAEIAARPRLHGGATVGASVTSDPYGHGDEMPDNETSLARVRQRIESEGLPDPYAVGDAA